ncbi:Bug family tripartite tricarboxylate transporter substrate binding protein [Massilia niastensis]|uniref:Bug family tripartite tricarboxylate transporter substrate binding protein n=1 Tax=Massilia niastensis TaxID=544911 RepID=UPI00037BFFA7|nr:tripartite tricarboxylate transporter substrate binding protein [Massilia niastensis]
MDRRYFLSALAALSAACALPAFGADSPLPTRAVRIVVGFPAGGGTDVLARIVATKLSESWGVPVIVDNKAGAAGRIAATEVARAAPDGTTLMMGHINALGIAPGLYPKLQYSAERDFTPIVLVGQTPQVLVSNGALPAKTLAAVVAESRKSPGRATFGSSGAGSAQHLALALFEQTAGASTLHVPYKGAAPLIVDLMGGQVEYAFEGMTTTAPYIKSGKLRAIAQTGVKRVKAFADVPTVAEAGYPGFNASIWFGLVGPAGMPAPMVARMNSDVNKVLGMPDVLARLEEFGAEDGGGTPERFATFIRAEQTKWTRLIRAKNIKPDS